MNTKSLIVASLLVGASINLSHAAGDLAAGEEKSQVCATCHAPDGNSTNADWPKLAGQNIAYLTRQLQHFRDGSRENVMMSPMATDLSDEDIADLAVYFSSQEGTVGEADPELVALGEQIYRGGNAASGVPACAACHGPSGAGNPGIAYPMLSGQHAKYTETQLKAFKAGERSTDDAAIMRTIAGAMSEEEIKAVSSFIQGLH